MPVNRFVLTCPRDNIRIRCIYGSRGSRDFRFAFRDSEARRGTSQGRFKESEQARPKAQAPIFFPRFSRKGLVNRFSHLAGDFGVSQSLAYDLRNRKVEAVCVIHWIVCGGSIVKSECLFVKIPEQMERLDADVASFYSALEQAPKVLKTVFVKAASDITMIVVNHFMLEFSVQSHVGHERIGIYGSSFLNVFFDLTLQYLLRRLETENVRTSPPRSKIPNAAVLSLTPLPVIMRRRRPECIKRAAPPMMVSSTSISLPEPPIFFAGVTCKASRMRCSMNHADFWVMPIAR